MNTDPLVKSIIGLLNALNVAQTKTEQERTTVYEPVQVFPALLLLQEKINDLLNSSDLGRIHSIYCDVVAETLFPSKINLELFGKRLCGAHYWEPFDLDPASIIKIGATFASRRYATPDYIAKLSEYISKGWYHAELHQPSPSQE